jgi:uncharacterized protein YceH (UPF0502 family)
MLRGPQTLGEIKGRTGRLAEFAGLAEVERARAELGAKQLAVQLPRRPGQKEVRYAHLLAGEPVEHEVSQSEPTLPPGPQGPSNEDLQRQIDELRAEFEAFRRQFS